MSAKVKVYGHGEPHELELWDRVRDMDYSSAIYILLERTRRLEQYWRARDPIGAPEFLDHDGVERLPR